ncbi:MAG: hypothetical protein HYR96_10150 [Deltaproteobacteria bacterium]|nr:hypothetical protein [Deltaproteobacteria bacterium]MBI3295394.1 hypothetical protein [Deltaproteobacteria bacterium]
MRGILFLLFPLTLFAEEYQFQGGFNYSPIEPSVIQQGAQYRTQISKMVAAQAGARTALAGFSVDRMEYMGALDFTPVPWVSWVKIHFRLNQQAILSIGSGATDVMVSFRVEPYPFSFLGLYAEGGWFERWVALTATPLLPAISAQSMHDHDFAVRFGLNILPVSWLRFTLSIGTIEEVLVYNFNNPFAELRTTYMTPTWDIFGFGRYKLLLGFGQLDEFAAGVGVVFRPRVI